MQKSDSIANLAAALCLSQAEIENATKTASNPFFKSKYADLAEVLSCIKPIITKHGLSFTQMPGINSDIITVETMILHSSGEFISSTCGTPAPKLDPQGIGSAITYLRRYSLSAVFGLAQEDDDGNSQKAPVYYSEKDFSLNFKVWSDLIAGGKKTAADIIKTIETRLPLTESQKERLENIEKQT